MDYFKKQFETIQQNLAGLNATQKMLAGALVVIMAMTMVYWSHYAGTADMEPVLNQTLNDEDVTRMSASLKRGIATKVEGGKVLVAADRKMQALAALGYEQLLPRNTTTGFDQMFAKSGPFLSPTQQLDLQNHGKEITIGQVISAFPNVQSAVVMIDPTSVMRIGNSITPSANISITMRGGASADNKLVNAAADLVCGAVAGMNREKIKVVVDGRPRRVTGGGEDGSDISASDQMDAKANAEHALERKIENQLSNINGVMVSVDGMLNTSTQEERSTTNDEKNTIIIPQKTETQTNETTSNQGSGGETGALPNVSASVGGGGGGGTTTSSTDTKESVTNTFLPASTQKTIKRPPGDYTALSASVRIPRSYFVGVLKGRTGKDPADAELDDYMKSALTDIRKSVRACTNIKNDEDIVVSTYDEISPTVAAASVASAATGASLVSGLIGGWGKEVGVGALAVISLFMVSTMVKRSTPAPLVMPAPINQGPTALEVGEDAVGLASEGGATLSGMELDGDAMQAQQVLDQVTSLVGENPDGAATLVKRWLNRA